MGRPTKLTDDVIDLLAKAIQIGLTYGDAAELVGIHRRTFERWRKKGRSAQSGIYCRLHRTLKRAEVEARMVLLKRIHDASSGRQIIYEERVQRDAHGNARKIVKTTRNMPPEWQAAAWILERRFPDEFGRNAKPQQADEYDPLQVWINALVKAESEFKSN